MDGGGGGADGGVGAIDGGGVGACRIVEGLREDKGGGGGREDPGKGGGARGGVMSALELGL